MKRKKLHYLPGIISIVGLPVLLFFWGPQDPVKYTAIPVEMPAATGRSGTGCAVGDMPEQALRNKKIISVDLNDMVWNQQSAHIFSQKLALVTQQIQYLQFTGDTSTVLKIGVGMKNDYKSIAWVLNEATRYQLNTQLLTADAVYLFPSRLVVPRYTSLAMANQPGLLAVVQSPQKWTSLKKSMQFSMTRLKFQLNYLFVKQQQNKLLFTGFLLLVLLPAIIKIRSYVRAAGVHYPQPAAA